MFFKNLVKSFFTIFILITILLLPNCVIGQENENVYVIPINGNINKATYQFVQKEVNKIEKFKPKAIIFEIDTYGGLISEAGKIKDLIFSLETPTISYVNNKAESAGVLITISSEKIAMSEGATIGSAETIPNDEKTLSLWVSWLRDAAERRGRDDEVIAAMADKDIEIDGLVKKGKLLNLNATRAKETGITDVIANSYEDILDYFNIEYNNIVKSDIDLRTNIAKYVSDPFVSTFLLMIGFIGLIVEVFTPGFGLGGTIGFIAFSLFFGGNILAGNSTWSALILFVVGIILLLIEAAAPGFGVPGVGGIISIFISIVLAMNSFKVAVISFSIAIIATAIVAVLLIKYGYKSPYLDKIILSTKLDKDHGYISSETKYDYLGKEGIAVTDLRPSGIISIDDKRLDSVSEGGFIEKGEKIKVIKVEGSKIIVKSIN